jgi:hypothetical protein
LFHHTCSTSRKNIKDLNKNEKSHMQEPHDCIDERSRCRVVEVEGKEKHGRAEAEQHITRSSSGVLG